uniref:Uncharacterized protein n=1 Tax=Phage sp. ctesc4 TaxID=2828008 RepID=A0A8S5TE80_9VIRU|nr:MAG TPA: hypothetical protein [Phage sp. ctesc4]
MPARNAPTGRRALNHCLISLPVFLSTRYLYPAGYPYSIAAAA